MGTHLPGSSPRGARHARRAGPVSATASPQVPAAAYVAGSCIVAVLAGVVLSRSSLLANIGEAIVYWTAYAVTCGILVNSRPGISAFKLLLFSLPAATVLLAVFIFELALNGAVYISGRPITLAQLSELWWLFLSVWAVSAAGIWTFSFARELVLAALVSVFSLSKQRAGRIEATLNWIVRIIGVVGLLARALVK